ncbi:MAG: hypothetical protein IPK55_13745 [Streptococcus sp.]|nr:hypothetical protein [Streptococcus sp.]
MTACGDGFGNTPEDCDDGNLEDGDGCSFNCKIEVGWTCAGGDPTHPDYCTIPCNAGSGYYGFYECGDGNVINGDGCDSLC